MGQSIGEIKGGHADYPDRRAAPEARVEHITLPELSLLRRLRTLDAGSYAVLVERDRKGKYSHMKFTVQEIKLP